MKCLTILLATLFLFTGCTKKESLYIETDAGAVIVGSIQKDDNGWYLVPEQPLDIKLTYYEENIEVFHHVTRFEMLESGEDGFDKILYEKQLVTMTGQILNPRGAGVLYLIPYKIGVGKMVEKSYGDPSITMPEKEEALKAFGNEFADFYFEVIDAYYAYMNHSGVCVTFAIAYSQLLSQIGIESTLASGTVSTGEGHVWNVVTIDQKNYFADPTYQITTQKSSYNYFGMNLEKRLNDGSGFTENDIWIGKYQVKGVDEISISNTSLEIKETSGL